MKKSLSILLTLVFLLTYSMSAFATGSTVKRPTIMIENGYKIEALESSKKNGQLQKLKFTKVETGEVEYLETYLENDKYLYLSISKEGSKRIESVDGTIKITNEDTKEVTYLETTSVEVVTPNTTDQRSFGDVATLATSWRWWKTVKSSTYIAGNNCTAIIGILCLIARVPYVPSALVILGTWYDAQKTPETWWISDHFVNVNNIDHNWTSTFYYKYPNWTNFACMVDYEWWGVY